MFSRICVNRKYSRRGWRVGGRFLASFGRDFALGKKAQWTDDRNRKLRTVWLSRQFICSARCNNRRVRVPCGVKMRANRTGSGLAPLIGAHVAAQKHALVDDNAKRGRWPSISSSGEYSVLNRLALSPASRST